MMKLLTQKYKFFIFDLDDTLYPEISYLSEAYYNIALYLEEKESVNSKEIHKYLLAKFKDDGRKSLFDSMLSNFKLSNVFLEDLLHILRTFKPKKKIDLFSKIYKILPAIIKNSNKVFVLTNGNVIQQKNKVRNINWRFNDKHLVFIYANEHKKKPAIDSFNFIKKKYNINNELTIMVGDSVTDKTFADNCNIRFMCADDFMKN